jgi:Uma2 family endonuclease
MPTFRIPDHPPGGLRVADLAELDYLGHHFQLIDGDLRMAVTPTFWHNQVAHLLTAVLRAQAPSGLVAHPEIGLQVDEKTAPEPDVVVKTAGVSFDSHVVRAAGVVLAVEIVSPGSERDDRLFKPALYAEAGVAHFWRVEREGDRPAVFAYCLNAARDYEVVGVFRDRVELDRPFPIEFDVKAVSP